MIVLNTTSEPTLMRDRRIVTRQVTETALAGICNLGLTRAIHPVIQTLSVTRSAFVYTGVRNGYGKSASLLDSTILIILDIYGPFSSLVTLSTPLQKILTWSRLSSRVRYSTSSGCYSQKQPSYFSVNGSRRIQNMRSCFGRCLACQ